MTSLTNPSRGEVWLVRFDPTVGAEVQKTRRAVIVDDDKIDPAVILKEEEVGRLPLTIVVPITEWHPHYDGLPWLIKLQVTKTNGLTKDSVADTFQVKSVSVDRLIRKLGYLPGEQVDEIAAGIALCV